MDIVHEMLTRFASTGVYDALYTYPDLQAYRTDKFEGFQRQPAETGPVLYSNSTPTYQTLKPISATSNASSNAAGGSGGDDGGGSGGLIAIIVVAALLIAGGLFVVMRRRSADERE